MGTLLYFCDLRWPPNRTCRRVASRVHELPVANVLGPSVPGEHALVPIWKRGIELSDTLVEKEIILIMTEIWKLKLWRNFLKSVSRILNKQARWLFLVLFWPFLKQGSLFEAAGVIVKFGWRQKPSHKKQI